MPSDQVLLEMKHSDPDFYSRLSFLHWAIEDAQNTVRFLDTKAAFCVTLLSGMVAVALQHPLTHPLVQHVLFPVFILVVASALLISLRVIFPTIIPHGSSGAPASPKFFIGHNKGHHWIHHTVRTPRGNVLSETHTSYVQSLHNAEDEDLVSSMAETAVTLAFIRQVKSDRLHSAMFCLGAAILLFAAIMLTQIT